MENVRTIFFDYDGTLQELPSKVKQFCIAMICNHMKYLIENGIINFMRAL